MIRGLPASGDLIDLGAVSPRVAPGMQIAPNQQISTDKQLNYLNGRVKSV